MIEIPVLEDDDVEVRKEPQIYVSTVQSNVLDDLISYYSCWWKMKSTIVWLLRYKQYLQTKVQLRKNASIASGSPVKSSEMQLMKCGHLTVAELQVAERELFKCIQQVAFPEVIDVLSATKCCEDKRYPIQDRIERGFTKMDADFAALKSELQHEIRVVKKELSEVSTSLETAWVEVEALKEKNTHLEGQLQHTLQKNSQLSEEVRVLKDCAIRQEDYSRRENLRFYNIPEDPEETNEECFAKVKELISELGPDDIQFHAIHRIGKFKPTLRNDSAAPSTTHAEDSQSACPRPVIARFVSRLDAECVWEKRKNLFKTCFSSVYIDKDLSAESAKERGKLRAAYRKAKEANIERVFIKGNKLFVNSSSYTVDALPQFLLPDNNGKP